MQAPQPDLRPIPQKSPCVRDELRGDKFWCRCGESLSQPYCDGSHKGKGYQPEKVYFPADKAKVAWCGCKRTQKPPYCDGSHNKL